MKKKIIAILLCVCMISCVFAGCGNSGTSSDEGTDESAAVEETTEDEDEASGSVTITNTLNGEDIDITYDSPQRIVSASGFMTELLLALGLEDKIVGYCYLDNEIYPDFADAFAQLTELSETNPSAEVLLDVEPDFLTGWASTFSDSNFNFDFCEANGISPYVPKIEGDEAGIDAVYEDLTNLGEIFGVQDKAAEVIAKMQDQIASVQEAVDGEDIVSVFIYDSGETEPYTLGYGLASDMIAMAGGRNIFVDDFYYWGSVSWESVVDADPEYIIVMDYIDSDPIEDKLDFLNSSEALQDVSAIVNGNIFVLGLTDVTGGIRNSEAVQTMAENFHPDCF